MFDTLRCPVIVAPMAGGPSTPELVAGAGEAGAFGFLAGGYLDTGALADRIDRTRALTGADFGVNLFVPGERSTAGLGTYVERVRAEAERYGVAPGESRWDDDAYPAKLDVVVERRVPVVSFTFGMPSERDVARLREAGSRVLVTVTGPEEAAAAAALGVDGLCVQGFEAGGHRGLLADDPAHPAGGELYGLLAAMRLVSAVTDLPLVAAGGLVHGADVAAVLAAGAVAAQLGTAFLRADEAGTAPAYRRALAEAGRPTAITRAFSGRPARGLVNRFLDAHGAHAPAAYPQVHHLTKPVRAAAGAAGDPEALSLWAGQTYALAGAGPVAEILDRLTEQARAALDRAAHRVLGR
ncbi:nitronate monooxygenase [Amycolatopsis arida]|uniref:Propionate 3-nitronate monooxygenase n=1 Tax=Amycolatopsis arida TaxID=587909 RepID=A0A1I5UV64_9PSEU|nr:nitronate monooxygenase [Amycolatopsis arida]TDX91045.1 nitronate monooxygenase [Amycolatopsis arida]SFP99112.1 nitronate monooxygenase [Amycolatopsis arida]